MTEKKFTLLEDTNGGLDTVLETMVKDNGKFLTHKECCDLLNELHEENQHKQKLLHLSANKIENLLEENQQLKKLNIPIDEIKDTVIDYQGRIIGVYYND